MKRIFLSLFFLTTFFWAAQVEAVINIYSSSDLTPLVYVQGLGSFYPEADGRQSLLNLEEKIKEREEIVGTTIKLSSPLLIFFPPTDKTSALIVEADREEIKRGLEINLPPLPNIQNCVLRSFYGPKIVDDRGRTLNGAQIWFNGSHTEDYHDFGPINPSAYMDKDQKEVRMVIHKPGFELKVVDVAISPKALEDDKFKPAVQAKDIVLNLAKNRVIEAKISNYSHRLYPRVSLNKEYYQDGNDYYFAFFVSDLEQEKSFVGFHKLGLGEDLFSFPKEIEIKPYEEIFLGEKVDISRLPATVPRVEVKNNLSFTDPAQEIKIEETKADTESVFDPKLTFLFSIIVLLTSAGLCAFFAFHFLKVARVRREFTRREEEDYITRTLNLCGVSSDKASIFFSAYKFFQNPDLNLASRNSIKQMADKIRALIDEFDRKNSRLRELIEALNKHYDYRREHLGAMKKAIDSGNYDLAMSLRTQVKEAEKQIEILETSIADLKGVIENRAKVVLNLMDTLEKMEFRAEYQMLQARGAADLSDLEEEARQIIKNIVDSFQSDQASIDPEMVKEAQEEREKAEQHGVSANDVNELKDFVDKRS